MARISAKSKSNATPQTGTHQNDASTPDLFTMSDDQIIAQALRVLESRAKYGDAMTNPATVKNYLRLRLGGMAHEVFAVIWLNSQNQVIEYEELFRGTINQAGVYPREVVKAGLAVNAAACILSHNHPSGSSEPSSADQALTRRLVDALGLVEIKVLDHMVATAACVVSFAERGLL